eukprot:Selendium_serpulae@DN5510_c0_g1_i5.p1
MLRYVYRALSQEDVSNIRDFSEISPKDPDAETTAQASITQRESEYVWCSKNVFVALYYAECHARTSGRTIVMIDLDALDDETDYSDLSYGQGFTSRKNQNFAVRHEVVAVCGAIPNSAIVQQIATHDIKMGDYDCNINQFFDSLPFETSCRLDRWTQEYCQPTLGNQANQSSVKHQIGRGRHKTVFAAVYTRGPASGHPGVWKESNDAHVSDDLFWQQDLASVKEAQRIVNAFNRTQNWLPKAFLTKPSVWTTTCNNQYKGLVEPYINNGKRFAKWNSNTGYESGDPLMAALSHFSYHYTKGDRLLCDLQGGIYETPKPKSDVTAITH